MSAGGGEGGWYLPDAPNPEILAGSINPDTILGIVNGEVIADSHTHFTVVETPDYKKIRFITRDKQVIEIRYAEEIFSSTRRIHLAQVIRQAQLWAEHERERGRRIFIQAKRKRERYDEKSRQRVVERQPDHSIPVISIKELRAWNKKRK